MSLRKFRVAARRLMSWCLKPSFVRFHPRSNIDLTVRFLRERGRIDMGRVTILRHSEITAPVSIGDGSFVNRDAFLRPETTIGQNVFIGPFVRLITDSHEIGPPQKRAGKRVLNPIVVEDGVWIGASVTVIGPARLGAGCVIAAGAVVIGDVPPNTIYGGVPARLIRQMPE